MRILLIESNETIAGSIELMLLADGMKVYCADTGEDGLDMAKVYDFDLVVLNPDLVDMAGLSLVRRMRTAKVETPILILSEAISVAARVAYLDHGADDCLARPFHHDELVARIAAIVRRSHGYAKALITVGELVVDMRAKHVAVAGRGVHLTGKEYAIVELLALRKGTVLTKEAILLNLYGGMDEPELKIIDVFICKLRKKLAEVSPIPFVETIWGRGYMMREPSPIAAAAPIARAA